MQNFQNLINNDQLHKEVDDTWWWEGEGAGKFSVHSAYLAMQNWYYGSHEVDIFQQLWQLKIPPKIHIFLWRLFHDRLPTAVNLKNSYFAQ